MDAGRCSLPWPCRRPVSALWCGNALCGGHCQCFSLWAALLILERTEPNRSSTLREFYTLLPSQRYTELPFPFNTCILCKPPLLAAIHRKMHLILHSSTLEVTALGQKKKKKKQKSSIKWMVFCMHKMICISCGRRGWGHSPVHLAAG